MDVDPVLILRFLAEDVGKHLDRVLDAILRALSHQYAATTQIVHIGLPSVPQEFGPEADARAFAIGKKSTTKGFHGLEENQGPLRGQ